MVEPTATRCWIMRLLITCIALGMVAALGQLIPPMLSLWQQFDWQYLAVAAALTTCYRLLNALGWGLTLRALQAKLPIPLLLRTWLRSEACRWIPGSVWCLGSRAFLAGELGVATSVAAASVALEFLLTIAAWVTACVLGLLVSGTQPLAIVAHLPTQAIAIAIVTLLAAAVATVVWLRYYAAGQKKLDKVRQQLIAILSLRPQPFWSVGTLGYYVALCILNGLALQYVLWSFVPDLDLSLLTLVGINALAWLVGFSTVIAPSGVVVREGCLAGLLIAWLPESTALAVAVTWRLVQIAVELTCLLATSMPAILRKMFFSNPLESANK